MKTSLLRFFVVVMGLCICSEAQAQTGAYEAPAKWKKFNTNTLYQGPFKTISTGKIYTVSAGEGQSLVEELPAPVPQAENIPAPQGGVPHYQPKPVHTEVYSSPMHNGGHQGSVIQHNGGMHTNQYAQPHVQHHVQQPIQHHVQQPVQQHVHSVPGHSHSAPVQSYAPAPTQVMPAPTQVMPAPSYSSEFIQAATAPWESCGTPVVSAAPAAPRISPWFGSLSLLFFDFDDNDHRHLIVRDTDAFALGTLGQVAPDSSIGFDAGIGRYSACGLYGFGANYFFFNPDEEMFTTSFATAGDYRAALPAFQGLDLDPGTGVDNVYNHYDGAAAFRVRRDVSFQGIEANLFSFGIMGARRVGACSTGGGFGRTLGRLGGGYGGVGYSGYGTPGYASSGSCGPCAGACGGSCGGGCGQGRPAANCAPAKFFGGAGGPLARACSGKVQVVTSHGFRWFQFKDEFELAGDINGTGGYQADDIYYNIDTENNLFGYQFGSRLHYCLGHRLLLSIGGKAGIYGNSATFRQRVGTDNTFAYIGGLPTQVIYTEDEDTSIAGLGEIDLGLGYRLSNCMSLRGGYRMMGASGVVSSTGSLATEYASVASSSKLTANDSFVLHGAYVGVDLNW